MTSISREGCIMPVTSVFCKLAIYRNSPFVFLLASECLLGLSKVRYC